MVEHGHERRESLGIRNERSVFGQEPAPVQQSVKDTSSKDSSTVVLYFLTRTSVYRVVAQQYSHRKTPYLLLLLVYSFSCVFIPLLPNNGLIYLFHYSGFQLSGHNILRLTKFSVSHIRGFLIPRVSVSLKTTKRKGQATMRLWPNWKFYPSIFFCGLRKPTISQTGKSASEPRIELSVLQV